MDRRSILFFLLLALCGCWQRDKKGKQDDFYTDPGSRDWRRIPLIKPYELNSVFSRNEISKWSINVGTTYNIKLIDVKDSIIYLISGSIGTDNYSTIVGSTNVPTGWFMIDTRQKKELGFTDESEFKRYLKQHKYPFPIWLNIDSVANTFANGGSLPWIK